MKIAVFVSGGGTNLQAIIDNTKDGILKDIEIALVLSSSKDAYALERAANNGIKSVVVSKKDFDSVEDWDEAVVKAVDESGAELIVLAGYLSLMGPKVVSKYSNRIINIHPALIPSFCGAGMYGIRPHRAALAKGVKVSGATVHFVNENYDEGPILLQKAVDVLADDTPETLQRRIMEQCEWKIMPQAVSLFCQDKLQVEGRVVRILP
jgi:phosphoribosylglycinamide formyltransferase-1